jgi:hypothetical protein
MRQHFTAFRCLILQLAQIQNLLLWQAASTQNLLPDQLSTLLLRAQGKAGCF